MMQDIEAITRLVFRILDENRTMALATLRPDGWPQATTVGYVHDAFALYFAVASSSQKLANIRRDPRTSIAIGHPDPSGRRVSGLSMAARSVELSDWREVEHVNDLIRARYPEAAVFAPRNSNAAVIRAEPQILSVVDDAAGLQQPALFRVSQASTLSPIEA